MSVHPERREAFNWLDFLTIVGFILACMLTITLILSLTTAAASTLSTRLGAGRSFRQAFTELGYQYAPAAMISLVIGLGTPLFEPLGLLHEAAPRLVKLTLFLLSIAWSLWLSWRILANQQIEPGKR